jgi:hypothetical protein
MQEFADQLIKISQVPDDSKGKADTTARIRALLAATGQQLGTKEKDFLKSLVSYWSDVYDLTHRQEHGFQKEGSPLIWEDARRVVFHTFLVMFEIDRALSGM